MDNLFDNSLNINSCFYYLIILNNFTFKTHTVSSTPSRFKLWFQLAISTTPRNDFNSIKQSFHHLKIWVTMNIKSKEDFWVFYMNHHSKPSTRKWHFVGTLLSIIFFLCSIIFTWWFLFLVPLSAYGFSMYSHLFIEGSFPVTIGYPFWSLYCDFKLFWFMITGKMDREMKRLGKRPVLQLFWIFYASFLQL